MNQYSTTVNQPRAEVWRQLLDKIYHPERFINGIESVEILEDTERYVRRRMRLSLNGQASEVVEYIHLVPDTVIFDLEQHPRFTGRVLNHIRTISDTQTELTYVIEWLDRHTKEPFDASAVVMDAVLKSKATMEATAL